MHLKLSSLANSNLLQRTRYLNVWLGCLPALLAIVAYSISTEHYNSVRAALETDNFLRDLSGLLSTVRDAETGQRGYLLTGRPEYLYPYLGATDVVDQKLAAFEKEASRNQVPSSVTRRIHDLVSAKINELKLTIELHRTEGEAAALREVETGRGRQYMDELRDLVTRITNQERAKLSARVEHQSHQQTLLSWVLGIGVGSGLLTLILVVRIGDLYSQERDRAETEIRLANESLELRVQQRTAELQRSNEDLSQFAYVASHDLQEPLRTVSSYVGLISRKYADHLDDIGRTYMRYAIEGAARMQTLINDLLQYSRAGTQALNKDTVSVETLVDTALRNLEIAVRESEARVTHSDLPTIFADGIKLTQVFQNLIGNAVKFRRGDQVPEVKIAADKQSDFWVFTVSDNGVGFDEKYTDRIFQVFQRLHGVGKYPGNGIGLAISKRIVEHHGGQLWAKSKPGEGSSFCFSIPVNSSFESKLPERGEALGQTCRARVTTNA